MKEEGLHLRVVGDYYDIGNSLLDAGWHRGSFGLHYGIWVDGIRSRAQAITYGNEYLADLANIQQGEFVLDAGCGLGGSAVWLARNRNAKVFGINLVSRQLKEARKISRTLRNQTEFARADFHNLPFRDKSFDVVWSFETIEHAFSVSQFVDESQRILKPGGRLVIASLLMGEAFPSEEQQKKINEGFIGSLNDHKTGEEVKTLMEEAGFKAIQLFDITKNILPSACEITKMCKLGARFNWIITGLRIASPIMLKWGLAQEELIKAGVLEYNVIVGTKS
jgi:ubiquinone/menaquinone biosynthesis C-methylase UbiE